MNPASLVGLPGLTYRKVDYWLRQGYVGTGVGPGSGNWRDLSDSEAAQIEMLGRLTAARVNLRLARLIVKSWAGSDPASAHRYHLGFGVYVEIPAIRVKDAS